MQSVQTFLKLRWTGHVTRMPDKRLPKKIQRRGAGEYEAKRISKAQQKRAQRKAKAKASPTELSSSDSLILSATGSIELGLVSSAILEHTNNNTSCIWLWLVIVSNDRRMSMLNTFIIYLLQNTSSSICDTIVTCVRVSRDLRFKHVVPYCYPIWPVVGTESFCESCKPCRLRSDVTLLSQACL